jgi:hypothetical protein
MRLGIAPLGLAALTIAAAVDVWLLADVADLATRPPPSRERVEWNPKLSVGHAPTASVRPIAEYRETLARPLFAKTRAPFVPPPPPPPPPVQAPAAPPPAPVFVDPGFSVGGVMITDVLRKAYLMKMPGPHGVWVGEGENFMGWKVQSIGASTAKLEQNNRTIELRLYPEK